jgi:hypothetical protein
VLVVGIVVVGGVVDLSEASAFKASALNEGNLCFDVDLGEREFPNDTTFWFCLVLWLGGWLVGSSGPMW